MSFTYSNAVIIQHCAVMGRLETRVRTYAISDPRPMTRTQTGVNVSFMKPRHRRAAYYRILSDNLRYLTIEVAGQVVYDSRQDIPCDMGEWEATNARFDVARPLRTVYTDIRAQVPPPGVVTVKDGWTCYEPLPRENA